MSASRRRRGEGTNPLRGFADTFMPYLLMIGAAMTWYANSATVTQVDGKFQESLKYTDKAVEAIRLDATSRIESVRAEAHRENESDKVEIKGYSDNNRSGMRIEFSNAIAEVKTQQAKMDSKLDYLVEKAAPKRH